MSTEDNKALVRRVYEETINQHNLAAVDQLAAPNFVGHFPGLPVTQGIEGLKQVLSLYPTAFPDIHVTIEDLIAERDYVVARLTFRGTQRGALMGIPPTGKRVTISALHVNRVEGGKVVEQWVEADNLGMLQQLGVLPLVLGAVVLAGIAGGVGLTFLVRKGLKL